MRLAGLEERIWTVAWSISLATFPTLHRSIRSTMSLAVFGYSGEVGWLQICASAPEVFLPPNARRSGPEEWIRVSDQGYEDTIQKQIANYHPEDIEDGINRIVSQFSAQQLARETQAAPQRPSPRL